MSLDQKATESGIHAFLSGYARDRREDLVAMSRFQAWHRLAAKEYERRLEELIAALPLSEVRAIASAEIHLHEVIGQVLGEHDARIPMVKCRLTEADDKVIEKIALEILNIESMEPIRVRSHDYPEISIRELRWALEAAYRAGMEAHHCDG